MATSLIQTLNKHEGKKPDEIIGLLTNNGWKKPSELGKEWFDEHKETLQCWYMRVEIDSCLGGLTNMGYTGDCWVMANCSPNYEYFCSVLETSRHIYWIIPKSEYQDGKYPPGVTRS